MTAVGIDPEVASFAQYYSFFQYFAMVSHMQFDCYRQYLNATNQSKIVQIVVTCSSPFHILFCYILTV